MAAADMGWPLPAGRPARPHWWSIQPPPPARPISARRAYTEVLLVFAGFFLASIVAGGETLARRYPPPEGSWAVFTPAAISEVTTAAVAVALVALLSARRGISPRWLGLGIPRNGNGKPATAQSLRIVAWALLALVGGGLVTSALATGRLSQPDQQGYSYLLYTTAASLAAGVIEEAVVLAFVVTTLRQARRPLPEVVIVAVLLRCSYHDYYGPGVLGIAVWATVFIWLFLRLGSVVPLIVLHFLWDATIFLGQLPHWKYPVATGRGIAYVLIPLAAVISWLWQVAVRFERRAAGTDPVGHGPGPAGPGPVGHGPGPAGLPPAG